LLSLHAEDNVGDAVTIWGYLFGEAGEPMLLRSQILLVHEVE
jgi:hypothetical protein